MAILSKPKPAADTLHVCVLSHLGPLGLAAEGDTFRGSDPRVQANPQLFADASLPAGELWALRQALLFPPVPEAEPKPAPKPVQRYRCTEGFTVQLRDGSLRYFDVGDIVREGDVILRHPTARGKFAKEAAAA